MKAKLITLALVFAFLACSKVPMTGRKQVKMVPEGELQAMSYRNYAQFLSENRISSNSRYNAMVKNSGAKISAAVIRYMNANKKYAKKIKGYNWAFNVVESEQLNAWCMPGGKVVFYTGIMPICQDEAGVAVVMGHEIAHAIASHGNERMSQGLTLQGMGIGLSVALQNKPQETQNLFLRSFGIGTQVGAMLPFSRLHESEADEMGLMFMAMAGYDPRVAIEFWERMEKMSAGQRPPEFLSTHPSPGTRVANLKKWMPRAMEYYNRAKK